jgi:hypothetical protein
MKPTMVFFSVLFLFVIETVSGNNLYSRDSCICDVHNLVEMQKNIDNLTVNEIVSFLSTFDGRCINNVEYIEFSNEILYSLLCHSKAYWVIKVLSENSGLPLNNIKQAIENPANDRIDINKAYKNIKSIKGYKNTKNAILKSINIAISKL